MDYRGRRVTIMGLGHFGGGVAAARWLARQGAIVTVTDRADEKALADSHPLLADVPLAAIHLGGHRDEDFGGAQLVVVNPAVRPSSPWLTVARKAGARLCTELELFMENCPARIVGVTGSNGKSTTAAMIASILRQRGQSHFRGGQDNSRSDVACAAKIGTVPARRVLLGGNIGGSLLERLPEIGPDDWVVLEISSFQLWHFSPTARMPHVAVVTSCTPNHLDWHGTLADYIAAKQRILTGQTSDDIAVLNTADAEVSSWKHFTRGRLIEAGYGTRSVQGIRHSPSAADHRHTECAGYYNADGTRSEPATLSIPGEHNRVNAACAGAAALACGCGDEDIRRGLERFRGLPQRLEWIAMIDGRRFYNDSAATTPESTIAALRSLSVPVWLLAGGKSNGADFAPLAAEIVKYACGAAFFGASRDAMKELTLEQRPGFACTAVETMEESLRWCWPRSRPGEAIVLSPACASTDQFLNFQQRGERFVELIRQFANPLNR